MKSGTARVQCKCPHDFQDAQYGKNMRVANATAKQDKDTVEVRCTVCSAAHRVNINRVK